MFTQLFANWKTWGHGLLLAVLGAVGALLMPMLQAGTFPGFSELQMVLAVGLAAGITYILKILAAQGTPNGTALFKLGLPDIIYTIFQTIVSGILLALVPIFQSGKLPSLAELKTIAIAGAINGMVYLFKNFFTNSQGALGPEPVKS